MRPKVLVDVDDTIADTQLLLIAEVNKRLGTSFEYDAMGRDWREGIDGDEEKMVWRRGVWDLLKEPETMSQCRPSKNAVLAMEWLAEHAEPHIVSARKEPLHAATEKWLADHGFGDLIAHIHPRPGSERGHEFKVRIAQQEGFEAAFEDTFEVAVALAPVVPVVYLIDKPWNRGHEDEQPLNVIRVSSFAEGVIQYLSTIEGAV